MYADALLNRYYRLCRPSATICIQSPASRDGMKNERPEQRTIQRTLRAAEVVDDCDKLRQLSKQIDSIIETEVAQLKKRRKKSELTALSRTDHSVGH